MATNNLDNVKAHVGVAGHSVLRKRLSRTVLFVGAMVADFIVHLGDFIVRRSALVGGPLESGFGLITAGDRYEFNHCVRKDSP